LWLIGSIIRKHDVIHIDWKEDLASAIGNIRIANLAGFGHMFSDIDYASGHKEMLIAILRTPIEDKVKKKAAQNGNVWLQKRFCEI